MVVFLIISSMKNRVKVLKNSGNSGFWQSKVDHDTVKPLHENFIFIVTSKNAILMSLFMFQHNFLSDFSPLHPL